MGEVIRWTRARESIALAWIARMHRMRPQNNMLHRQALFVGSDAS